MSLQVVAATGASEHGHETDGYCLDLQLEIVPQRNTLTPVAQVYGTANYPNSWNFTKSPSRTVVVLGASKAIPCA